MAGPDLVRRFVLERHPDPRSRGAPRERVARACANTRTIRPPCSSCWARRWARWCCWPPHSSSTARSRCSCRARAWSPCWWRSARTTSACAAWRGTSRSGRVATRVSVRWPAKGQIIVTVEATDRASSYQGVVPITGNSLAESLEALLRAVRAAARPACCWRRRAGVVAGMLVQRMPAIGGTQRADRRRRARCGLAEGGRRDVPCCSRPGTARRRHRSRRLVKMFGVRRGAAVPGPAT